MREDPDHKEKVDPAFVRRVNQVCEMVGGRKELASRAGLSPSVIDKYAQGKSDPSRQRVVAIAHAAGVSVQWLASGEGPMNPPTEATTEQAAPSEPPIDKWLFSRVIDGLRTAYKVAGAQLPVVTEVDEAFKLHNRIAALTDVQEERYGALLMALDELEEKLRSPRATETEATKRSA